MNTEPPQPANRAKASKRMVRAILKAFQADYKGCATIFAYRIFGLAVPLFAGSGRLTSRP